MDCHRGWNIKCYDRVKISHLQTGYRLHSNEFDCKAGSYNQAVSVHKVRDETDWFVAVHTTAPNISYHFQYGDVVILSNDNKQLQLTTAFKSPISSHHEVSLGSATHSPQHHWLLESVDKTKDQYWRVGDLVRFKHQISSSYLAAHKLKIKENDDYQVYGQDGTTVEHSQKDNVWLVSQIQPFIYSAPITALKVNKKSQEVQHLDKLKKNLENIPKKSIKKTDHVKQLIKQENARLQQIQDQHKKINQQIQKRQCWKKYFCCCFYSTGGYKAIK